MSTETPDNFSSSPAPNESQDETKIVRKAAKKTARKATKKVAKKRAPKKEVPTPSSTNSVQEELPLLLEGDNKEADQPTANEVRDTKESPSKVENPPKKQNHEGRSRQARPPRKKKEIVLTGDPVEVSGLLEIASKGYGFLRCPEKGYSQAKDDVFVSPEQIRTHGLRHCVWIDGAARMGGKGLQLTEVKKINGDLVKGVVDHPFFDDLKAINPDKRISLEMSNDCYNTRVLDLVSPIGRGQRGLIVAPPRSGKTTLLRDIAQSIVERHEEKIHPIFLLIDERPEEVTEFKRTLPDIEMFSSSNDSGNRNHMRIAELCIERAKRLVEQGKHVFILMDSITRLARAYNRGAESPSPQGRGNRSSNNNRGYQSGGIVAGALEVPRRLFAAARNTREAGSLTILATALIHTNSKADEAIFQEFKGTGNMEIVLDRRLADHYIYPAIDIFKSGTRREELLLPEMTLRKFHLIRRGLKGHRVDQAMERLLYFLKKFPNNAQMLMEIKG